VGALVTLPIVLSCGVVYFQGLGPAFVAAGIGAAFVSAIVAALVAGLFGGPPLHVSSPKTSHAAILSGLIGALASQRAFAEAFPGPAAPGGLMAVCFIVLGVAALCQLLLGASRLGGLVKFVPYPVLAGIINGFALQIILGQLPNALGVETLAQVFAILCAADPSLGQIPQNHFAIVQAVADMGSEAQKQRWFADVLAGHRFGNAGPERKARAAQVQQATVRLEREPGGGLYLSGTRFYSTGAAFAHWVPLRAAGSASERVFLVLPAQREGLAINDDWDAFGQRTTASGSVVLARVPVAEDDVVPVWRFAHTPTLSGPVSQLIQAAIDAGIAQAALRDALDFVRDKSRPWIDAGVASASADPHIVQEVGQLQIAVDAAHAVLLEAARTLDALARQPVDAQASARASFAVAEAKILTTEAALQASEQLFALAG